MLCRTNKSQKKKVEPTKKSIGFFMEMSSNLVLVKPRTCRCMNKLMGECNTLLSAYTSIGT